MNNLYNYKTGKYELVPEELAQQGILDGSYGFPSDKPVKMVDAFTGELTELPAQQALTELSSPSSNLQWYSAEKEEVEKERKEYGGNQIGAALEGAADVFTMGGYQTIAEGLGFTTKEDIDLRAKYNTEGSMLGTISGVAASFWNPFKKVEWLGKGFSQLGIGVRMADRIGVKAADKVVKASKSLLGKGAPGIREGAVRLGVEGAVDASIYNAIKSLHEPMLGDEGFSAESYLAEVSKNAYDAGKVGVIAGGAIGGSIAAIAKGVSKVVGKLDNGLDNYYKTHYEDVGTEYMGQGGLPRKQADLITGYSTKDQMVVFKIRKKSEVQDGIKEDEIIYWNGHDGKFMTADEAQKLDVINLDASDIPNNLTPYLKENYAQIIKTKSFQESGTIEDLIESTTFIDELSPALQKKLEDANNVFMARKNKIDKYERGIETLNMDLQNLQKRAEKEQDLFKHAEIAETIGRKEKQRGNILKTLEGQWPYYHRAHKKFETIKKEVFGEPHMVNKSRVKEILSQHDGVQINGKLYVFNPSKLNSLSGKKLGRKKISAAQDSIFRLIGVGKGQRKKMSPHDAKRMEAGIRDIVEELTNNKLFKMVKVGLKKDQSRYQVLIDSVEKRIARAEDEMDYIFRRHDQFQKDSMENINIGTGLTYGKLREILEKRLKSLLTESKLKSKMDIEEAAEIKKQLDPMFHGMDPQANVSLEDLRMGSIKFRKEGYKWSPFNASYMKIQPKISREMGEELEQQFQRIVKINSPEDFIKYKKAREEYAKFINIKKTLDENVADRVRESSGLQWFDVQTFGGLGTIGGLAGGPVAGLALGGVGAWLRRATPEMKALLTIKIDGANSKWFKAIDDAATGFTNSKFGRSVVMGLGTNRELYESYQPEYEATDIITDTEIYNEDNMGASEFLPQTSAEIISRFNRGKQLIADYLPKENAADTIPELTTVPSFEVRRAARIQKLIKNPRLMLAEVQNGYITNESAQILNDLYPSTKEVLMERILDKMSSTYFSPRQKSQLKQLFGQSSDPTLTVNGFNVLQSSNKNMGQQQQQPGQAPTSARPFKKRPSGDRTDIERRLTR